MAFCADSPAGEGCAVRAFGVTAQSGDSDSTVLSRPPDRMWRRMRRHDHQRSPGALSGARREGGDWFQGDGAEIGVGAAKDGYHLGD
jgi:hypothetical protein